MELKPVNRLARDLEIPESLYQPHGRFLGKIELDVLQKFPRKENGHYILVTASNPTPFGEGKTVTSIALSMALNRIGKPSLVNLRQSSMGPLFGVKGGGAGGGKSRIVPEIESVLHLTGDIHAVTQAHNQMAAMLDNSLFRDNPMKIDNKQISFPRVTDVNDRFLRKARFGIDVSEGKFAYDGKFSITAASEIMAILTLASGETKSAIIEDVRKRLGSVVMALTSDGTPITAKQLKADPAALAILKNALLPNLMQTSEGTPALLHGGPFANIAHGCSSIIADNIGSRLSPFIVTEAGFGADLGAEKFFNIKCRQSGMFPSLVVLVTSVRSIKYQSGNYKVKLGQPMPKSILESNLEDLQRGSDNIKRHLKNLKNYGTPVLVAINRFESDSPEELAYVKKLALESGADDCAIQSCFLEGSKGAIELAEKAIALSKPGLAPKFVYPLEDTIEEKVTKLTKNVYGASGVKYSEKALAKLKWFTDHGFNHLPICMAKTPFSFSHDPKLLGAPSDYDFVIDDFDLSAGAGFIVAKAGGIMTMPGLNAEPIAQSIYMDGDGAISGLV